MRRAQKQIAELEAEIEALEEELEKATSASKEAGNTRAAIDTLTAETLSLKEQVTPLSIALSFLYSLHLLPSLHLGSARVVDANL